jgi:ADP-ribosylglycohydrolase
MLGAIAGDVIGSSYEHAPVKTTDFELFTPATTFTDDTVLTVATAFSLLTDGNYAENYRIFGRLYPMAGYGGMFMDWLSSPDAKPYGSWGNGSAMRVAPVGWAFDTADEVLAEAERSAAVTHDHPEGIKGAQAVALGILRARQGASRDEVCREIAERFGYDLDRTVDGIRPDYKTDLSCQGSVPESLICFREGDSWLDTVRLAISLGGDADTMACIAGGLAEAAGARMDPDLEHEVRLKLPDHLLEVVADFMTTYTRDS